MRTLLSHRLRAVAFAFVCVCLGCTDDGAAAGELDTEQEQTQTQTGSDEGDAGEDASGDGDGEPADGCGALTCEDALILDLSLQQELADGEVTSALEGEDWVSQLDASAGGAMAAATKPWLYLRFTPAGLERVDIDDLEALSSTQWHIAAKRFGIRVNSGSSGPGCVELAALPGSYGEIDALPEGLEWSRESFYDDSCVLIEDASGVPGNPAYAMASWWAYAGCVTTTGQVFALALDDGTTLELTVEAYYAEGQDSCNEMGVMGSGAAQMSWRWRQL